MWLITGTIPDAACGLCTAATHNPACVEHGNLILPDGHVMPVARGTAALAATAILACQALDSALPGLLLAGDIGTGQGSELACRWLADNLASLAGGARSLRGLTFHYFYPDVDGHNRVLASIQSLPEKPVLVADAGFMYVAKMSGYATEYDLFTPDMGELAFLADEKAPHPFYTRGFLLAREEDAPGLLERALKACNCPANLIIKGARDYIVCDGQLRFTVSEPSVAAMEAIGGTGDIVTGFATAFLQSGASICQSALWSARAARQLARFCQPTPATQVADLISRIPDMLQRDMNTITAT